jgi:hypothetical protein
MTEQIVPSLARTFLGERGDWAGGDVRKKEKKRRKKEKGGIP